MLSLCLAAVGGNFFHEFIQFLLFYYFTNINHKTKLSKPARVEDTRSIPSKPIPNADVSHTTHKNRGATGRQLGESTEPDSESQNHSGRERPPGSSSPTFNQTPPFPLNPITKQITEQSQQNALLSTPVLIPAQHPNPGPWLGDFSVLGFAPKRDAYFEKQTQNFVASLTVPKASGRVGRWAEQGF